MGSGGENRNVFRCILFKDNRHSVPVARPVSRQHVRFYPFMLSVTSSLARRCPPPSAEITSIMARCLANTERAVHNRRPSFEDARRSWLHTDSVQNRQSIDMHFYSLVVTRRDVGRSTHIRRCLSLLSLEQTECMLAEFAHGDHRLRVRACAELIPFGDKH